MTDVIKRKIERLAFKKVEVWLVFCLSVVGLVTALLYGGAVRHYFNGGEKLGRFGGLIETLSKFPSDVRALMMGDFGQRLLISPIDPFESQLGFYFSYEPFSRPDLGYVLINRYDGDNSFSKSELWDLNSQVLVHSWNFKNVKTLLDQVTPTKHTGYIEQKQSHNVFRSVHGLLDTNGRMTIQTFGGSLIQASHCSQLSLFSSESVFHHSIEKDTDGYFWVPSRIYPKTVNIGSDKFYDDGIAKLDTDGRIVLQRSVIEILVKNGMGHLIYGTDSTTDDPVHLNDIQPVNENGIFWNVGDVFLSIRNLSLVLLYRPSTNEILWHSQGPWLYQHDINILDDHRISVFNNNTGRIGKASWEVKGVNNILIYDFLNKTYKSEWQKGFQKLGVATTTEGRGKIVSDEVFVEESNYGRALQFDKDGNVTWSYVNRANNGNLYILNWSRLIPRTLGDVVTQFVSENKC